MKAILVKQPGGADAMVYGDAPDPIAKDDELLVRVRATAVNRVGARLVGILPSTTGATAFLLASTLAAISGILIGPVTTLYYDSGFLIGLKAFVGAIIGGLVSYPATAVGAILVGLFESYASFFDSSLKEVFVFGALIPILIWRSLMTTGIEEEFEEEEHEGRA